MSCTHDTLSPYTRPSGSGGPTQTFTVSKRFAQRLRGVLSRINAAIRRGIIEADIFNLQEESDTLEVDDPGPFDTDSTARMQTRFMMWLREQLNSEFLTVVGPDRNQFIEKAYLAGLRNANSQLRDLDISFVPEGATSVVDRPIHQSALRELFTRTYENLESVTSDVADAVRDELVEGFTKGHNPRKIARSLTDRVDSIGKHRATMIARSEVINAHSESTLTRVDEIQEDVGGTLSTTHGEWDAAEDSRVCPFCRALDGVRLETSEMRATVVNFRGQTYRLKPPAHVNGRCAVGLRVGGEITTPLEERLPAQVQIVSG